MNIVLPYKLTLSAAPLRVGDGSSFRCSRGTIIGRETLTTTQAIPVAVLPYRVCFPGCHGAKGVFRVRFLLKNAKQPSAVHENTPKDAGPSGQTWQQVMDTSAAGGSAYYQLAPQYIAAVLNRENGAPVPSSISSAITWAEGWLPNNPVDSKDGTAKARAGVLDQYNQGVYPGGPAHCE